MATNKLISAFALLALFTAIINSTVANQTTTVPLAYRAIVGIVLIIIVIIVLFKFFKYAITGLLVLVLLIILISTTYYFFKTGSFSISYSLKFLADIYNFFVGGHIAPAVAPTTSTVPTTSTATSTIAAANSTAPTTTT